VEEEITLGQLLGWQELNDRAIWIGLVAPLTSKIKLVGGFLADFFAENILDSVK